MASKNQQIAKRLLVYLKNSYNFPSKGIPISDKETEITLYHWARSKDGLPNELRPKKEDTIDDETKKREEIALKKSLKRALDLLMEENPRAVGFYVPASKNPNLFNTLEPKNKIKYSKYKKIYKRLYKIIYRKRTRYYLVKTDKTTSSLSNAFAQLVENSMGQNDFEFLNDTIQDSLTHSTDELKATEGEFHKNWLSKIEISSRYQALYPPKLNFDKEDICKAVFLECSFEASYLEGGVKRYWPVRLIRQERVLYVLCRIDKSTFYEEYAIHRFKNITIDYHEEPKPHSKHKKPDWLSYDKEEINKHRRPPIVLDRHKAIEKLVLKFYGAPAQHMSEVSFHLNKKDRTLPILTKSNIIGKGAQESEITARNIDYNYNFLTWLLGFGSQVKVIEPPWLIDVVKEQLRESLERY